MIGRRAGRGLRASLRGDNALRDRREGPRSRTAGPKPHAAITADRNRTAGFWCVSRSRNSASRSSAANSRTRSQKQPASTEVHPPDAYTGAGNILTAFRQRSDSIRAAFRQRSDSGPTTFRGHTQDVAGRPERKPKRCSSDDPRNPNSGHSPADRKKTIRHKAAAEDFPDAAKSQPL